MKPAFRRRITAWLVLAASVSMALAAGWYVTLARSSENGRWVEHTHVVLYRLRSVAALLEETAVGVRGFALSGEDRSLKPYRRALPAIGLELRALRQLTADHALQQRRLDDLDAKVAARLAEIDQILEWRRDGGIDAAVRVYRAVDRDRLMDGIREAIAAMEGEEQRLLALRGRAFATSVRRAFVLFLAGTTANLVILALLFRVIVREFARRSVTERTLRRGEQRFRSLVEATTAMVWDTPACGEFTAEQPGWSSFSGQSFDELKGWGWLDVIHPDDRPHTARLWAAAVADRAPYEVEHRLRRHNGEYRHMLGRAVPILAEDGTIVEWIGVHIDNDVEKRAQEALRGAKEAAEAASRAKGEFLANVSHEIRTPMNAILGMTELTLDTDLTPDQRENLTIVGSATESLLSVINDLLDFSKIEAGKLELDPVEFGLRDALGDTLGMLGMRAHAKGLELSCRVHPDVPDRLIGDPARLRQVLVNLVGNSIKFTERGEVVVEVEVEAGTTPGIEVVGGVVLHFRVIDTGIGVPPGKLEAIFAPFAQADGSTTRLYGGTGLGLAISSQLVGLMGGRIWVESEVGRGSTFHFTAGLAPSRASTEDRACRVDPPSMPAPSRPLRILLTEDNAFNQRVTSLMLAKSGHTVTLAVNGREAVEAVARQTFDLVLMDLQMPDMDGFQATAAIRSAEAGTARHIPILGATAHARKEDRIRCLEAGMDGYVSKPIQEVALRRAIEECVLQEGEPAQDGPRDIDRHGDAHDDETHDEDGETEGAMDVAATLERLDGDCGFLREMAGMFLEECPPLLAQIREAFAAGDPTGLVVPCHTLKNWIGNFFAPAAYEAVVKLEALGRAGSLADARGPHADMEREIARIGRTLARIALETVPLG